MGRHERLANAKAWATAATVASVLDDYSESDVHTAQLVAKHVELILTGIREAHSAAFVAQQICHKEWPGEFAAPTVKQFPRGT